MRGVASVILRCQSCVFLLLMVGDGEGEGEGEGDGLQMFVLVGWMSIEEKETRRAGVTVAWQIDAKQHDYYCCGKSIPSFRRH